MPTASYERFGLTGNPFRELASENLEDVTIYHVNQASDAVLRTIFDEVLDKENRAVVAITGPQGAGKTQRLLLASAQAKEHQAFCVYFDVPARGTAALTGLALAFEKGAKDAGLVKFIGGPSWLRSVSTIAAKGRKGALDPKDAGHRLGEALNASAPALLLLNDLHNLADANDLAVFAKALEEITAVIRPGVLLMFTCYASYLAWLATNQPALASRVNRTIPLALLSDDEARLILAKKLLAKRIVEDLEPTYPFDRDSVRELNRMSRGNPRRLFQLADLTLERAVAMRAYQIDTELVRQAVLAHEAPAPTTPAAWSESETSETNVSPPRPASTAGTSRPERKSLFGRTRS